MRCHRRLIFWPFRLMSKGKIGELRQGIGRDLVARAGAIAREATQE